MPQMAPLMWLPFLIFISCSLYMTNSLLYFQPNLNPKAPVSPSTKSNLWLW